MKPIRNPELEALRESILKKEKVDQNAEARRLVSSCKNIHAIYLFHPEGTPTLKALCTVLSSTPTTVLYSSWKDMAGFLGLSYHQIGCIENYKYEDNTELVLKTFAQRKEATIDMIIEALQEINRFDAVAAMKIHIEDLIDLVKRQQVIKTDKIESGCFSNEVSMNNDGILRPEGFNQLSYQLPLTLRDLMDTSDKSYTCYEEQPKEEREVEILQRSCIVQQKPNNIRKCSRRVMVTFSKDGEKIARQLAKDFRRSRNGNLPIGVLILDEHQDKVSINPERFIIHTFAKMDFVIPIVTEGYLEALGKSPDPMDIWSSCVDFHYVQLIHDLMSKYYVEKSCRNDKFRCIIPDSQINEILRHPHMKIDPVLKVFFRESEINQLAERILKSKRTR